MRRSPLLARGGADIRCHAQAGLPRTDLERPCGCVLECVCVCVCVSERWLEGEGKRGGEAEREEKKKRDGENVSFPDSYLRKLFIDGKSAAVLTARGAR